MPFPIVQALLASIATAQVGAAGFHETLRAADARLAAIGHRLATANVGLCDRLQPATGLVTHALGQYGAGERDAARRAFEFESPVAVEAVVEGAAADRGGVRPDEGLVAVNGAVVGGGQDGTGDRDRALDLLESGRPAAPITLSLRRGGATA